MTISFVYSILFTIVLLLGILFMLLYGRNKDAFNKRMIKVLVLILILPWVVSLIYISNFIGPMGFMILYAVSIIVIAIAIGFFAKKTKISTTNTNKEFIRSIKTPIIIFIVFMTVIWLINCYGAVELVLTLKEKYG